MIYANINITLHAFLKVTHLANRTPKCAILFSTLSTFIRRKYDIMIRCLDITPIIMVITLGKIIYPSVQEIEVTGEYEQMLSQNNYISEFIQQ